MDERFGYGLDASLLGELSSEISRELAIPLRARMLALVSELNSLGHRLELYEEAEEDGRRGYCLAFRDLHQADAFNLMVACDLIVSVAARPAPSTRKRFKCR